ncbi:hypothetical protein P152DRAFT_456240 [Eremomyces bilateralis CBS 781.70]|uniref:Ribosome assembly factor mrt4 n=1 Tax=Eremomyces bilateralis CBS 781.70 TaxID=1392243 RepID=A0A6G1GBG2_9PEZI|nr:uncharacterized protein P152DRAFT_456240 [Eremomyces bilateralis CBS 781.70]KAF1815189.1 hypothetical protein P152DRAFT_456240 [Eremomyces bilateralis CBS 781.70]
MPKSKRARVVHLSKVEKKTKEDLQLLQTNVEEAAEKYPYGYVVFVDNMRNNHLKGVRTSLAADSRIFFGRNRIMARAMGTTPATEPQPGLHTLSEHLDGPTGLIFSSRKPDDLLEDLKSMTSGAYGRAGTVASRKYVVPAGIVYTRGGEIPAKDDVKVTAMQEVHLRAQGLPTRLEKGDVLLDEDYTVCKKGEVLTGHQSAILKFFGVEVAEFQVRVKAYWSAEAQTTTVLDDSAEKGDEDTDMDA